MLLKENVCLLTLQPSKLTMFSVQSCHIFFRPYKKHLDFVVYKLSFINRNSLHESYNINLLLTFQTGGEWNIHVRLNDKMQNTRFWIRIPLICGFWFNYKYGRNRKFLKYNYEVKKKWCQMCCHIAPVRERTFLTFSYCAHLVGGSTRIVFHSPSLWKIANKFYIIIFM